MTPFQHALLAAERIYYEMYHGDERYRELVPKFTAIIQEAIDAAVEEHLRATPQKASPATVSQINAQAKQAAISLDEVRCPQCGYTEADRRLHNDHHLCANYPFFEGERDRL